MKSKVEKYRTGISRIVAVIFIFFLLTTQSYWDINNKIISFLLFLLGIIFVAIASLGRMWCSLYIAGYKDNKLITQGPYSLCRNPLYFFSLIGAIGVGFTTETLTFSITFIVLFAAYYGFVIKSEESRLRKLFGVEFEQYAKTVPVFFPKFSIFKEPEIYNVNPIVFRTHIYSALWFIWIVGILELLEGIKEMGYLKLFWIIY